MTRKSKSSAAQKRRTPDRRTSNRPLLIVGGVVAVGVVAAVIAFALASSTPAVAEPAESPIVITGTVLPPFEAEVTDDPAVGMTLPTVQGTDVTGAPMTIGPDGRAKVVLLLAHWCPHCQAEVPRLVAWLAENPVPDGVDIVAVSTAADPTRTNYPASAWLEREGWPIPTLNDDATLAAYRALGGPTFPGFVFVTADGVVQSRTTGEISVEEFGGWLEQIAL
ncbi:MAG TPA: TlpA disulfide reductase family protein [Candidatus Limnocylindria bacterium]|nr:TlpA disulfide reductase family protein [Candidatus Limnocylindria bacterium]